MFFKMYSFEKHIPLEIKLNKKQMNVKSPISLVLPKYESAFTCDHASTLRCVFFFCFFVLFCVFLVYILQPVWSHFQGAFGLILSAKLVSGSKSVVVRWLNLHFELTVSSGVIISHKHFCVTEEALNEGLTTSPQTP